VRWEGRGGEGSCDMCHFFSVLIIEMPFLNGCLCTYCLCGLLKLFKIIIIIYLPKEQSVHESII